MIDKLPVVAMSGGSEYNNPHTKALWAPYDIDVDKIYASLLCQI
jgi:hypothetical protein